MLISVLLDIVEKLFGIAADTEQIRKFALHSIEVDRAFKTILACLLMGIQHVRKAHLLSLDEFLVVTYDILTFDIETPLEI